MNKRVSLRLSIFIMSLLYGSTHCSFNLETIYGNVVVHDRVIGELITSPVMQRLKELHQYGITAYIKKGVKPYSRYDHSLGVFYLTRLFNAPLQEQIAALLHDVSHTAFSHVGDYVFKHFSLKSSYQDDIHLEFIALTDIPAILTRHGFGMADVDHKKEGFTCLEQELPDICADRLEYVLHGGYVENMLSLEDIQAIIVSLRYEQGQWFFVNENEAKRFAYVSLYLSEHCFGSADNFVTYSLTAKMILHAFKIGLITVDQFCYGTDAEVLTPLIASDDPVIKKFLMMLEDSKSYYTVSSKPIAQSVPCFSKFRGIDPYVNHEGTLQRLSTVDASFKELYHAARDRQSNHLFVTFNSMNDAY